MHTCINVAYTYNHICNANILTHMHARSDMLIGIHDHYIFISCICAYTYMYVKLFEVQNGVHMCTYMYVYTDT